MKRIARLSALAVALSMMLGAWAGAADQTVLGRSFIVKNPGTPDKRKVTGAAKETGSSATIVGDPTVASSVGGAFPGSPGGAILTIIANGDHPTTQTFGLKQGTTSTGKPFWRANGGGTGFKYKDPKGDNGAVKVVIIKKTVGGVFSIKAVIRGKNGPLNVVPPNLGTDGFMTLLLGGVGGLGDRYCVQYGGDNVKNDGDRLFKVRRPPIGVCPGATTTTTTSTTTTTMPGSPSAAFLDRQLDQLD
jgi:hypothetical protein